jgi:AbrB family looped-hinge helix DNA binding protein
MAQEGAARTLSLNPARPIRDRPLFPLSGQRYVPTHALPIDREGTILHSSYQGDSTMAATALTTVVSTKGQVILPKAIREQRHWPAGTRLTVEETPEGVVLKPAPLFPETSVAALFGSLAYKGSAKSIAEMDEAVAAEARRRARG